MGPIIGIDLGTTNSLVAYMKDGQPVIVPSLQGEALTPSVVTFADDDRRWVGQLAKTQAQANPLQNASPVEWFAGQPCPDGTGLLTVVSSIKRQMGSDHVVEVGERAYTPAEISAMILEKLKADAETYLGESVERAVITVPAYFNNSQRRATRAAATLAGLEVVRLVNEPTAAALAYGLDVENAHTVLVWDLGGGTFDVSILELGDGVFEVKAVGGNTQLGGDDYDKRLAELLADRFRVQWHIDLDGDPVIDRLMRQLAEEAKIKLSSNTEVRVLLPHSFGRGSRCAVTITRDEFEEATADITEKMVAPAHCALSDAGLDPIDLDRVVLVGGMTRMPMVRQLVKKITGLEPYGHIDPDKVVALGAAIQAGVLAGQVRNVTLVDVTPLSLGIETQGGLFARIIKRNTPIPATSSRLFTNARDNQTAMEIHVLQGERELAADNMTLGNFELVDITPQSRGQAKVEVTFDIDANGMVQVSATDLHTEASGRIRIEETVRPGQQIVNRILTESQKQMESDQRKRKEVEATIRGENLIQAAKELTAEVRNGESSEELHQVVEDTEKVALTVQAALAGGSPEEIDSAGKNLEALLKKLSLELKTAAASVDAQNRVAQRQEATSIA